MYSGVLRSLRQWTCVGPLNWGQSDPRRLAFALFLVSRQEASTFWRWHSWAVSDSLFETARFFVLFRFALPQFHRFFFVGVLLLACLLICSNSRMGNFHGHAIPGTLMLLLGLFYFLRALNLNSLRRLRTKQFWISFEGICFAFYGYVLATLSPCSLL